MPTIRSAALSEADETLVLSEMTLNDLANQNGGGAADFSMFSRHAKELHQYLSAHRAKLVEWRDQVANLPPQPDEEIPPHANPPTNPAIHLLTSYRFDLDSAVRFVVEAFLKPRRSADSARVLEAADWYCVDAFQELLKRSGQDAKRLPVGPIVAIDSQRSPAIWKETAALKIPSLFTESITVRDRNGSLGSLPPFPVICLPADLTGLPEYLVLLAHEVGHAVDDALGVSVSILEELGKNDAAKPNFGFWKAWMREIVADAAAAAIAGEAFTHALWRYMGRQSLNRRLTESHPYPPAELRLMFLRLMLGIAADKAIEGLPDVTSMEILPDKATELKDDFEAMVLPILQEKLPGISALQLANASEIEQAVKQLRGNRKTELNSLTFLQMPSVFALAIREEKDYRFRARFKAWHLKYRQRIPPPDWINAQSDWQFTEDMLPTLRATLLGPDGITKYPPIVLLAAHHRISFVGSTNKWLTDAFKTALPLRKGRPWDRIDVFFASNKLLEQVERYDNPSEEKWDLARLKRERDQQLESLKALFQTHRDMIKKAVFHFFDGPALFASYWDSDARYGRIHVSTQLLGIDIGQCPATDHLWLREEPTSSYRSYQEHLRTLETTAHIMFTLLETGTLA
ncbi:hypothetical protein FEM03_06095 [Phragmitibacter flavus]|uniref:Uncharacterized protein n=1 Tax=Phragmitibacter flavus TaxID=2576071 RepID=A0A5R8KHG7_9BACT|nr:hypothetical protein [Phragmitibacter flavus]TLD71707.1 hypothetical protein FEM03_06095 [Phragmitibacter flavus]